MRDAGGGREDGGVNTQEGLVGAAEGGKGGESRKCREDERLQGGEGGGAVDGYEE